MDSDQQEFMTLCERLWQYRGAEGARKIVVTILNIQSCAWCRAPFSPTDTRVEYCSHSCGQVGRRQIGTKRERINEQIAH